MDGQLQSISILGIPQIAKIQVFDPKAFIISLINNKKTTPQKLKRKGYRYYALYRISFELDRFKMSAIDFHD